MKILVVDDNYTKVKKIHSLLEISNSDDELIDVRSSWEALETLKKIDFDIVVIDIYIPELIGEEVSPEGGVDLLHQIELSHDIFPPKFILGLTQHSEDFQKLQSAFSSYGWMVFLDEDNSWQELLKRKYDSIKNNLRCRRFEFALVSALYDPELRAFLNLHGVKYQIFEVRGKQFFEINLSDKNGKKISIVAAACERMGMSTAATLTSQMAILFEPRLLIMNGICAGVQGSVALGDIIVAEHSWDYSSGKVIGEQDKEQIFHSDPHHVPLDSALKRKISQLMEKEHFCKEIFSEWSGQRDEHHPSVKIGPIACGAQVVADDFVLSQIKTRNRKVIALDMESYGFMNSCSLLDKKSLVIKSVCDFASSEKNDDYQQYAAYTSSAFIFKLLVNRVI